MFKLIKNMIESKRRPKSEKHIFRQVHERVMRRLKTAGKLNGVLEKMSQDISSKKKFEKQNHFVVKSKKTIKESKLLPIKRLRLDSMEDTKKNIPKQGFVQFYLQNNDQENRNCLFSTISQEGIMIIERGSIEFLNHESYSQRCKKYEKLKKIETIKNLRILKPFLKWKRYSKANRFSELKSSLEKNLSFSQFHQICRFYHQLTIHFKTNRDSQMQEILKFLFQSKEPMPLLESHRSAAEIFFSYIKQHLIGQQCLKLNPQSKMNPRKISLCSESFLRILQYHFQLKCDQLYSQICISINIFLSKLIKDNIFSQESLSRFLSKEPQSSDFALEISVLLGFDKNQNLIRCFQDQTIFCSSQKSEVSLKVGQLKQSLFESIDKYRNISKAFKSCTNKKLLQFFSHYQFFTNLHQRKIDQVLGTTEILLQQLISNINKNQNTFRTVLSEELSIIYKKLQAKLYKTDEVENQISKIESLPTDFRLGTLRINLRQIKNKLFSQMIIWEGKACERAPKDISVLLQQFSSLSNLIYRTIDFSQSSLETIIEIRKMLKKLQKWKEQKNQTIDALESFLNIKNRWSYRIDPKAFEKFYQLTQIMKTTETRKQFLEKHLIDLIKRSSQNKKAVMEKIIKNVEILMQQIILIRNESRVSCQKIQMCLQRVRSILDIKIQILMEFCSISESQVDPEMFIFISSNKDISYKLTHELEFYLDSIRRRDEITQQIQKFVKENGQKSICQISKQFFLPSTIEFQKHKVIKKAGSFADFNQFLYSIVNFYESQLNFFKALQICKKSKEYHIQTGYFEVHSIASIYDRKDTYQGKQAMDQLKTKLTIFQDFLSEVSFLQNRFETAKISEFEELGSFESLQSQNQLESCIEGTIQQLNSVLLTYGQKLPQLSQIFSTSWGQLLKEQKTNYLSNIKSYKKAITILERVKNFHHLYNEKKLFIEQKLVQLESLQKIKGKWPNVRQSLAISTISLFLKNINQFEVELSEVEALQNQITDKISAFTYEKCASFPFFYMFDKAQIMKFILKPIMFLQRFFQQFKIDFKNNSFLFQSRGELLKLQLSQSSCIQTIFSSLQFKIQSQLIEMFRLATQNYKAEDWLENFSLQVSLQVIYFVDYFMVQNYSQQVKPIQKISKQIISLGRIMCIQRAKVSKPAFYLQERFSLLLMNRIQIRDIISFGIKPLFRPIFEHEEGQSFYLNICSRRVALGFQLVSSRRNSILTMLNDFSNFAMIHRSFNDPQSTLIMRDNTNLSAFSFRVMKYMLQFSLSSPNLNIIIRAALKCSIIINFIHKKQEIKIQMFENAHMELYKIYQATKISHFDGSCQKERSFEWPIFISHQLCNQQYFRMDLQTRSFFRNLKPIVPQIMPLLEWNIRVLIFSSGYKKAAKSFSHKEMIAKKLLNNQLKLQFIKIFKLVKSIDGVFDKRMSSKLILRILRSFIEGSCEQNYNCMLENIKKKIHQFFGLLKFRPFEDNFVLPDYIPSNFHISNCLQQNRTRNEGIGSSSSINLSYKTIDRMSSKAIIKTKQPLPYHSQKLQEFFQKISRAKLLAILGSKVSGKSNLIERCLNKVFDQYGKKQSEKTVILHNKALGESLWTKQKSIFSSPQFQNRQPFLVFKGQLKSESFPFYSKMLETSKLYYRNGQKIFQQLEQTLIFQVQNSFDLDPSTLVSLAWIFLDEQQLKWTILLLNAVEKIKQQIKNQIQSHDRFSSQAKIIQILTEVFIKFRIKVENIIKIFFQKSLSSQQKNVFINSLKFMQIMKRQVFLLLNDTNITKESSDILSQELVKFWAYGYYLLLKYSSFGKNCQMDRLKEVLRRKASQKQNCVIQDKIPVISVGVQHNELKFVDPFFSEFYYKQLTSSLKLEPNKRIMTQITFAKRFLQSECSIIIKGSISQAKKNFLEYLQERESSVSFTIQIPNQYSTLLKKIKSYEMGTSAKINIVIQDIYLEHAENQLASKLKYLIEHGFIINKKKLVKKHINIIILSDKKAQTINQFTQFPQFEIGDMLPIQCIYSYLQANIFQPGSFEQISAFDHSSMRMIFLAVQKLLSFSFQTFNLLRYSNEADIIFQTIKIIKKNMLCKSKEASNIFQQIYKTVLKLISFRLSEGQMIKFNKSINEIRQQMVSSHRRNAMRSSSSILSLFQQVDISAKKQKEKKQVKKSSHFLTKIKKAIQLVNVIFIQQQRGKLSESFLRQAFKPKYGNEVQILEITQNFSTFAVFLAEMKKKKILFQEKTARVIFISDLDTEEKRRALFYFSKLFGSPKHLTEEQANIASGWQLVVFFHRQRNIQVLDRVKNLRNKGVIIFNNLKSEQEELDQQKCATSQLSERVNKKMKAIQNIVLQNLENWSNWRNGQFYRMLSLTSKSIWHHIFCAENKKSIISKVLQQYSDYLSKRGQKIDKIKKITIKLRKLIMQHRNLTQRETQLINNSIIGQILITNFRHFKNQKNNIEDSLFQPSNQSNVSNENEKKEGNSKKIEKNLKICFRQAKNSLTRKEISDFKFVCGNAKNSFFQLGKLIAYSLTGEYSAPLLTKILFDTNLMKKVWQCRFKDRTTQSLYKIIALSKQHVYSDSKHILKNLVQWAYYGAKLELSKRSMPTTQPQQIQQLATSKRGKVEQKIILDDENPCFFDEEGDIFNQESSTVEIENKVALMMKEKQVINARLGQMPKIEKVQNLLELGEDILKQAEFEQKKYFLSLFYKEILNQILSRETGAVFTIIELQLKRALDSIFPNLKEFQLMEILYFTQKTQQKQIKYKLTWLQQRKMEQLVKILQQKKNILIIDRQKFFSRLVSSQNFLVKQSTRIEIKDSFNFISCQARELQENSYNQIQIFNNSQKTRDLQQQCSLLTLTNTFGKNDHRYIGDSLREDKNKSQFIDFGINSFDLRQLISEHISSSFDGQLNLQHNHISTILDSTLCEYYTTLNSQNLNIQSKAIDKIFQMKHQRQKDSVKQKNVNTEYRWKIYSEKILQIFEILELSHYYSIKFCYMNISKNWGLLNIPEKSFLFFTQLVSFSNILNNLDEERRYKYIENSLIYILLSFDCSEQFKTLYFLQESQILSKDKKSIKINFFRFLPFSTLFKKLIESNQSHCDYIIALIAQLGLKNTDIERYAKLVIQKYYLTQSNQFSNLSSGLNYENIWIFIKSFAELNFYEKLMLARIFIPDKNSLSALATAQINQQSMQFRQKYLQDQYGQSEVVYICLCDKIDFWLSKLPQTNQFSFKIFKYQSKEERGINLNGERRKIFFLKKDSNQLQHFSNEFKKKHKSIKKNYLLKIVELKDIIQIIFSQITKKNIFKQFSETNEAKQDFEINEEYLSYKRFEGQSNFHMKALLTNSQQASDGPIKKKQNQEYLFIRENKGRKSQIEQIAYKTSKSLLNFLYQSQVNSDQQFTVKRCKKQRIRSCIEFFLKQSQSQTFMFLKQFNQKQVKIWLSDKVDPSEKDPTLVGIKLEAIQILSKLKQIKKESIHQKTKIGLDSQINNLFINLYRLLFNLNHIKSFSAWNQKTSSKLHQYNQNSRSLFNPIQIFNGS